MATIPSIPTLPSFPEEPGFWDSLTNSAAKAQDYAKKGSDAYDRARDLYGKGTEAYDKAKGLLDGDGSLPNGVPGLNGRADDLRGRADDAAAAKRRELDGLLADLEDSPEVPDATEQAAAKRRELDEMLADLEDSPGSPVGLPLVGTDTDGFFDAPPAPAEETGPEAPAMAEADDQGANVVCVCRNLLNTLDTRAALGTNGSARKRGWP